MKESDIQRQILDYLKARGIWAWKNHTQGTRIAKHGRVKSPTPGKPDIEGCLPGGVYLAIEVKMHKGRRSSRQIEWIAQAQKLGAVAFFAESLGDVEARLNIPEATA